VRILITGGAGFIGSHLCDYFLEQGHEVICMDNLLTGSVRNIAHIRDARFSFIEYDVTNYMYVDGPLDAVLHFASPASPIDYLRLPIHTLKVGALGTHKALGLALARKARFLLASTSEVYGDPQVHPEALTMAYHRYHGVDTKIVRIFNTFGPRMRREDGRAVPVFINQALRGEPMTIFGDGRQTRSFGYITDLTRGIDALLNSTINDPVNIGNPQEMTVLEMAEHIRRLTGSRSELIFKPLPEDDPKVRQPNIDLARRRLGWEPHVDVQRALELTIGWFREADADREA